MNIFHIIASMDPSSGGPSQVLRNIVPVLINSGVNSEVICLDDPQSDFLKQDIIPIYAIGKGKGKWHYQRDLLRWLNKNVEGIDIIIIHGLWLYHGFAVYKALKNVKTDKKKTPKLYIMAHGMLDPWFQKAKGRRIKAIRNWFYWKIIESKIINAADGILFTCLEELVLARKTFKPYYPKKEINVGYGINYPPFFTLAHNAAFLNKCPAINGSSYILFLSRIHEKKAIDLLISAYLLLKNKYDKLPKLVIAGPGLDTRYGRKIKKLAAGTNDILFPGMLTGDAKWGAFYGCEVFILPSHQENFGIAIVEAMACGKPVLITNKINIWREIKAGGGGLVAGDTLNDIHQLLETWCLADNEKKKKMGTAAKKTFEDHFSVEKAAVKFLKAITTNNNLKIEKIEPGV